MQHTHICTGTCSRSIEIDVDTVTRRVRSVRINGGCRGNTQGIAALVVGMAAEDVVARLEGIRCGDKPTSCPDQLAKGVRELLDKA